MTPDDRLRDLLREDAGAYRPGDGRAAIGRRIRSRQRRRTVLRAVIPAVVAVVVAAIVVPTVTLGRSAGNPPATPVAGPPAESGTVSPAPRRTGTAQGSLVAKPTPVAGSPATATVGTVAAPAPTASSSPPPSSPSESPVPSPLAPSAAPTGTTTQPAWKAVPFIQRPLNNPTITPTPAGLYLTWDSTTRPAPGKRDSVLARIDPATGKILAQRDLGGGFHSVLAAHGDAWVTVATSKTVVVYRMNPTTLAIESRTDLAHRENAGGSLAVAGGALWVANGDQLVRISLDSGKVIGSVELPDGAGSTVASDDAGTLLLDGEAVGGLGALQRRDPATGRLIASHPMAGVSGPGLTTVTGDSLWVTEPTGMLGYVQRFDAQTLKPAGTPVGGTNDIHADLWDGRIWIMQMSGRPARYCADPATGAELATIPLPQPQQDQVLAVDGGYLYFSTFVSGAASGGGGYAIDREPVPAACNP